MQNDQGAKVVLVGYDPKGENRGRADWYLKVGRYYLNSVRGIEASRISVVNGGSRDGNEMAVELWLVPEGAEPPVKLPTHDKYSAKEFSGKFDTYATDALIYRLHIEMGYSGDDISRQEFSERLKRQPNSRGYLVVRAPKGSPHGTWRRVGLREEQIIRKDYEIEARRLSSVNGGIAQGDYAEVDLWILPKSARPPAAAKEEQAAELHEAVRLSRLDPYGSADEDAESWMLKSIAAALRENPRSIAAFVTREPMVYEDEAGAEAGEPEDAEAAEDSEDEPEDESMKEVAERWKKVLTARYGVYPWRVVVLEGKRMAWSSGRLTTWLVPEKARWPDPQAPDEDEAGEQ
jgi:hypothetical protein